MKKKGFLAMLIFCLFLIGGAWAQEGDFSTQKPDSSGQGADSSGDGEKIKLTVWLDEDNEFEVRGSILNYNLAREQSVMPADIAEKYFLDIQWELVEKNYLSPEQYRMELKEALEKGEGPDIIYMDSYNGVDPMGLMEAGVLADLGDLTDHWETTVKYIPGALEPKLQDGKNYVMPLFMECPIVFGLSEELEQAGIRTEEMYGSLEEFLDALLLAQEKTGKQVFEDDAAVDWLEQYYMPDDAAQKEALAGKLEQLRAHCGTGEGLLDAYKGLADGTCLLGGCGIYDYKRLAANLSMFGESSPVTLVGIPSGSGDMKGIITHAAAVNAASEHVEEAVIALRMFQNWTLVWAPDLPVMDAPLENILGYHTVDNQGAENMKALYYGKCRIPSKVNKAFLKCLRKGVGSMAYAQGFHDISQSTQKTGEEKKVISISCPYYGGNPDHPVTKWLKEAAEVYMQGHRDVCIQFMEDSRFDEMFRFGVAPDAVIRPSTVAEEAAGAFGDFSAVAMETGNELERLPDALKGGIQYNGKTIGLPVWAEEYGIWCSRKLLAQAGLAENWQPVDAAQMTEGFRKLKQVLGPDAVAAQMDNDYELFQAMALFLSEPKTGLLKEQADGTWRCSKEGWVSYLSCLKGWQDEKLAVLSGSDAEDRVAMALAEGKIGAWIAGSSMSGWFDGSYGLQMTAKQQEDILFIPLSPAVNVEMVCVSADSDHVQEVYSFWEEAVQSPGYAQAVRDSWHIPITELSGIVQQTLPAHAGQPLDWLWPEVWGTDKSAEELAEEHPWFEWTEE